MSGEEMEPDEMEREALFLLTGIDDAEELQRIYAALPLDCPETLHGKPHSLLKYLLRYLNSEEIEQSEDAGHALFLKLYDCVTAERKPEVVPDESEEKNNIKTEKKKNSVTEKVKRKPLFDVQKLKDFKISGTIGGPEKKDSLSFSSLSYQISNGLKQGYSEELVCAAVLKAISPGNNLRTYLESKKNLNVTSLLEVMRSHFHEKDSSSIFTELSNAVQEINESCLDFVIRTMCLRQKIFVLGVEEGCPYEETLIQKRFLHTIETGLRNNNIRAELRDFTLKRKDCSDEALLKAVTEAVANETERYGKLFIKKRESVVNSVEVDKTGETQKIKKDNQLQIQIKELKLNQEKELAAMRTDLLEIKSVLNSGKIMGDNCGVFGNEKNNRSDDRSPNNNFRNYEFPGSRYTAPRFQNRRKCLQCESSRNPNRCMHCFKCGSLNHRMAVCNNPEKNGL